MKRKYKKHIFIGFAGLAVLAVIFMVIIRLNNPEKTTLKYFNKHRAELEEEIPQLKDGEIPSDKSFARVSYWRGKHPIIEYEITGRGIAPASTYYGFFYSFDNVPAAYQNADIEVYPISDVEWEWNGDGDNHGIIRKLDDNWFYYEASF